MPQEMQILRCYSCEAFQVHIVKKVPKWECKICGEKQSIKKVYGKGSGKDCRLHVQQLNQKRLEDEQEVKINQNYDTSPGSTNNFTCTDTVPTSNTSNRWEEFLSGEADTEPENLISNYEEPRHLKNTHYNEWELNGSSATDFHQVNIESSSSSVTKECHSKFSKDTKSSRWEEYITPYTNTFPEERENCEILDYTSERPSKKPKYAQTFQNDIKKEENRNLSEDDLNFASILKKKSSEIIYKYAKKYKSSDTSKTQTKNHCKMEKVDEKYIPILNTNQEVLRLAFT